MKSIVGMIALLLLGAAAPLPPMMPDRPASYTAPTDRDPAILRDVMIPMRDGVKLHTVIIVPKGLSHAPIMLVRSPYGASGAAKTVALHPNGSHYCSIDPIEDGYICAIQDVRGKYGSEGDYVMTRPLRGPLNATATDHATDAYDTIDWLVKNVPESNGKVGITGGSYVGFTTLMATIDPHPALKVAVAVSPMVDGWRGDDWFHNGAFRQSNYDYISEQTTVAGAGDPPLRSADDDYTEFLQAGSADDFAQSRFAGQLPYAVKLADHPAYDGYWQNQAVDNLLAARPLTVPLMLVTSQWDQEDIYGGQAVWKALNARPDAAGKLFLVMGPWHHSQMIRQGAALGALRWPNDTSADFRRHWLKAFFDQYLKDGAPAATQPRVLAYETGTDGWKSLDRWPLSCATGCTAAPQRLYLAPAGGLGAAVPAAGAVSYVSDPMKPVPFVRRPVALGDHDQWSTWLVADQRFVADRPDVLSFATPVLDKPVHIAGATLANLVAATTGSDGDFVVKLIDVYPDRVPGDAAMGGYQLGIAMDIFRGRYRESFETPHAIVPGAKLAYRFALPNADHVFLPGHRIMVQVQSSWFPLYDRNPQSFVPNIFTAKPGDYKAATVSVITGAAGSFIDLPVVPQSH